MIMMTLPRKPILASHISYMLSFTYYYYYYYMKLYA